MKGRRCMVRRAASKMRQPGTQEKPTPADACRPNATTTLIRLRIAKIGSAMKRALICHGGQKRCLCHRLRKQYCAEDRSTFL